VADNPTQESALLLLVQRVSEMQLEQGKALQLQSASQHEISTALAVLNTRLEPLTTLTGDIHALQLQVNSNTARLTQHADAIMSLGGTVDALKTANNTRRGWEGPAGKLVMLVAGAVIAAAAGFLIPKAQAETPRPPQKRPVYEHPCWAVPAERNKHQWLWV
jgi:hypothetical protein